MKNNKLKILDAIIQPGETANLALPLPEQYSCTPLYMPIKVIHGKYKGPCLLVFSAINGNELNGIEIINKLEKYSEQNLDSGTLIAIPVMNVYGLTHYPHSLPMTHQKLEDCFPGQENGSFGSRFAHLFTHEILKKADYCIELQTGGVNHNILPQVYCSFDNYETKKLAQYFQSPVITNVKSKKSSFRKTTDDLQIPLIVYQGGEALRFDQDAITVGFNGIVNTMCHLDMCKSESKNLMQPIYSQDEDWIVAHKSGILHTDVKLGQSINKHQTIGKISDPFGAEDSEYVKSHTSGIVVGINTTPLIHEGLPIFKIASFLDDEKAETIIEKWDKSQEGSFLE